MQIPETLTTEQYIETYPRYIAAERSRKKSEHTLKLYDLDPDNDLAKKLLGL